VAASLCPTYVGKYRYACEFLSGRGAAAPFVQDPVCGSTGTKHDHDVDQRCTLTCNPGYHLECGNVTTLISSTINMLTSDMSVGVKMY
jgi:hypothetical protein